MAVLKPSAKATETVEYLETLLREVDHFAALVEQFAGAQKGSEMYASQVSRQLAQLRQKAMMRNLGYIADAAGQLSVMASRGGSPMMKGRMLRDGVVSFRALIERSIRATITADESEQKEKAYLAEQAVKAAKAETEAIRARVLAEEAKEAAKAAASGTAAPKPAVAAGPPVSKPAAAPGTAVPKPAGAKPATAPAPAVAKPAVAPEAGAAAAAAAPVTQKPAAAPRRPAAPGAPRAPGEAAPSGPAPTAPAKPDADDPAKPRD